MVSTDFCGILTSFVTLIANKDLCKLISRGTCRCLQVIRNTKLTCPKSRICCPVKLAKQKNLIGLLEKVICGGGRSFYNSLKVMRHLLIRTNILGHPLLRQLESLAPASFSTLAAEDGCYLET